MPKRNRRPVRVHEVKLRHRKVWGEAYPDGTILIDPRQRPRQYLNTLIHEVLHTLRPSSSETWVKRAACRITRTVWEAGYRRIAR